MKYPGRTPRRRLKVGRKPTLIAQTTTTTNWAVASGVTLSVASFPTKSPSGRTSGLKVAKPTTGTFGGVRFTGVPANWVPDVNKPIALWLWWGADQGSVSLRLTSDAFATKRVEFSWAYMGQLHKGWNLLVVRPNGDGTIEPNNATWVVTGGQAWTEVINGIQISINTNTGNAADIYLDGVYEYDGPVAQGCVCFGFDKYGEASIPTLALPLLSARGIKAYWAGDGNLIDGPTTARGYLQTVYDAGWDAISQGMNHPDYAAAGAAQLSADYDQALAIFQAQGFFRGSKLFSYPLSSNNEATDAVLLSKGVYMARSGWAWSVRPNDFNAGPKLIGHGAFNLGGKTLAQAKAMIDRARVYGSTEFLFCHGLAAGGTGGAPPADTLYWYADDYAALLDYAVASRTAGTLDILSPTEWIAQRYDPPTVA